MPQGVVELLEPIEVGEDQRALACIHPAQCLLEPPPVHQAGERVGRCRPDCGIGGDRAREPRRGVRHRLEHLRADRAGRLHAVRQVDGDRADRRGASRRERHEQRRADPLAPVGYDRAERVAPL